mgnify:CR=1 FL=1
MRRLLICLTILGISSGRSIAKEPAETKASPEAAALESLTKEFEAETKAFSLELRKAYEQAKKAGKQDSFKFEKEHPSIRFSPRFLAIAKKAPETPAGFDAIRMALNTSGGPDGKAGTWPDTIKLLREHYATKPGLKRVIAAVAGHHDELGDQFVRDVIARNPSREIQAKAYLSLAEAREEAAEFAKLLESNEELRKRIEKARGKA